MRRLIALALLLPAVPAVPFVTVPGGFVTPALAAQEREIREANLPDEYEQRLLRIFASDEARRESGEVVVGFRESVPADLAVTGGPLRVEGRIEGDVGILGGDVVIAADGSVIGDVLVVGGTVRLEEGGRVGGQIVEFSASALPERHAEEGRRSDRTAGDGDRRRGESRPGGDRDPWSGDHGRSGHDHWSGEVWEGSGGSSVLTVRTGPSYNRVEGLPLMFGPVIRTRGSHPLRVEALGIWRTAARPSRGTDRWGYRLRVDQTVVGDDLLRIGGSAYSVVDPINRWQVGDGEATLAAVGFHQDFRDHFSREGWSAGVGVRPTSALDFEVEYREAEHRALGAADPWALFDRSRSWRLQPLVGEGELRSVAGKFELDLRDDPADPFSGWYARAEVERGVGGTLVRPGLFAAGAGGGGVSGETPLPGDLASAELSTDFTTVFLDLRRYAPVSRTSQLDFRVVAGGNVEEEALPPQFQHALGGPGSLPGFASFHADCGARAAAGVRDGVGFFPSFGCDRFVLGQVEFRGRLSLDLGVGEPHGDGGKRHEHEWHDVHGDLDPQWLVFFDAGTGWAYDPALPGGRIATGSLYDAGAGFLLGEDVGVYFAVPLNHEVERDARFFVRLQRRF